MSLGVGFESLQTCHFEFVLSAYTCGSRCEPETPAVVGVSTACIRTQALLWEMRQGDVCKAAHFSVYVPFALKHLTRMKLREKANWTGKHDFGRALLFAMKCCRLYLQRTICLISRDYLLRPSFHCVILAYLPPVPMQVFAW